MYRFRSAVVFFLGVTVLFVSSPAARGQTTFGPFPDFKGFKNVAVTTTINTYLGATFHIPFDGNITIGIRDRFSATINVPVPVFVPTYVTVFTTAATPFNPATDSVILTDIVAMDLNPSLDPALIPPLTGFNAVTPELVALGLETFDGARTGTPYSGPFQTVPVAGLASLLPGYDLSAFNGANPNSIVYVARVTVPASDLVPEPASLAIFAAGSIGLMLTGKRRRA
jgi:hypothetical protein